MYGLSVGRLAGTAMPPGRTAGAWADAVGAGQAARAVTTAKVARRSCLIITPSPSTFPAAAGLISLPSGISFLDVPSSRRAGRRPGPFIGEPPPPMLRSEEQRGKR